MCHPLPHQAIARLYASAPHCENTSKLNISFHKLRHDHASRLSANGVSIKDAQYRLGHSTTQMLLNVYTHRISGGQEKIASWLNSSFPAAPLNHETPLH
ncbi:tyrosine-type recombinase/integrase [Pelosinus fermentans]|uniref:tyrosine-type recombinase/integrase n=1 Tax=Pelosinus fermentans TaxID=365349 RepID=UPI0009D9502A